jgi:predicted Fe-Mo cluster-binding NifX family protein
MRLAISSDGKDVKSKIDQRFGRCKYFLIVNTENPNKVEAVENEGAIQGHGAGIKAAQQIAGLNVQAVITGSIGPNAASVLDRLKIKAYNASGTVKDAINTFIDGRLAEIQEVSLPHSGMPKERKAERIFFPLIDNNGIDSQISHHFGHAPFFGVYDVGKKELKVIENRLDHTDPTKSPIDQIEEAVNPTTIFAKGIGARAISIIAEKGLSLKTGDYDTVKEVVENLDKLEDQTESCSHKH